MIYTVIISLLIEKPFYLLSPQSFSFQMVSEFIDIFVKFSLTLCPGGGAFDSLFCPKGRVFVHNDCPGGRVLLPSSRIPGVCPGGMVMDEIDTCINLFFRTNDDPCCLCLPIFAPASPSMVISYSLSLVSL